jgi:hypothetical protein
MTVFWSCIRIETLKSDPILRLDCYAVRISKDEIIAGHPALTV